MSRRNARKAAKQSQERWKARPPMTRSAHDEEKELAEVKAGASRLGPEADNEGDDAEANVTRLRPGSYPSREHQRPTLDVADGQQDGQVADMGANSSHQDFNKDIRNAAAQLRNESGMAPGARPSASTGSGSGTLRRPSVRPRSRNLALSNGIRRSVYDLGDSPDRHTLPVLEVSRDAAFSPRRRHRKVVAQPHGGPRRSTRVQAQGEHHESSPIASQRQSRHTRANATEADAHYGAAWHRATDNAVLEDWASEHPQTAEQARSKERDPRKASENGERDQLAGVHGHKSGRPRKNPADEAQVKPPDKVKGRPGRLRKTNTAADATSSDDHAVAGDVSLPQAHPSPQKSQSKSAARAQLRLERATQSNGHSQHAPGQSHGETLSGRRSSRATERPSDLDRRHNARRCVQPIEIVASENTGASITHGEQQQEGEDELPGKLLANKPVTLHLGEVRFIEPGEASQEFSKALKSKKRKELPHSQVIQDDAGKRTKPTNAEGNDQDFASKDRDEDCGTQERAGGDGRSEADKRRLWGQWLPLKFILQDLKYVGRNRQRGEWLDQNEIELEDEDVRATCDLCEEARDCYEQLGNAPADARSDPASVLTDIGKRIEGLCGRNDEFPTDFNNKTKIRNIYFHLIPSLVRLIWKAVSSYETIDRDRVGPGKISTGHLRIVTGLTRLTTDMESAAANLYKARPDTSDAVVQSVRFKVAAPLRKFESALQRVLRQHDAHVAATQHQQREAEDRALRLEQEERRRRQSADMDRARTKWERLHIERSAVEGALPRPVKMAHLAMPDPDLDLDCEGMTFHRVQLFHPRVGPPPGLVDRAAQIIWTHGELMALEDGLRNYKGNMVFERTFRAYCPPGRILNKYNVIEIVTAAATIKQYYEGKCGDAVQDWVKMTPVWTSQRHSVGQENRQSYLDVDDAVAGPSAWLQAAR